jgi:hypothetical protein
MKINAYRIVFLLCVFLLLGGCKGFGILSPNPTPSPTVDIAHEENAIYNLTLVEVFGTQPLYVIDENTRNNCDPSLVDEEDWEYLSPELQDDTLEDFLEGNQSSQYLPELIYGDLSYSFVNGDSYKESSSFENSCFEPTCLVMERFKEDYPNAQGVIELSNIGFSDDRQQALICAEMEDGGDIKSVQIRLLIKTENIWLIESGFSINSIE